ncbi:amidohydrolase family protein [Halovulum dunhuangense]|uniref:Amidohydrolase family protein n=1 Tax=Halovulum dunhuangense TaxID=1505036 RepID=A0A849L4S8_9RHOB|nr:amidohydrolase family protein [Halovulum dunhuangense]NNU81365.1 amidohydrolase family protein [Halovulum dunhuangense]
MTDILFNNALLDTGETVSIATSSGRITAIGPGIVAGVAETVDLGGALVVPGFVEGHIHLDTSFYGDSWKPHKPCLNGFDVHERVRFQNENLAEAGPIVERARNQLELCIANGATAMRSHAMIDNVVGLTHVEALLQVRSEYSDLIDLQLVAFPQSGIITNPGTAELMDEAIAMGCDLVGGLDPATFDRTVDGHLDVVFDIAERRGVDMDIHLHDFGTVGAFEIEVICARTEALGMQGHVAVSHAYGLGDLDEPAQRKIADLIAKSGVSIMTNAPGHHSFPPVRILAEAGANVFSGSDNIQDSWWPYGDGDMLTRAMLIGYRCGFFTDELLRLAFDVTTRNGAKAMRLDGYGLEVGDKADLVALAARHVPEAVASVPKPRKVFKGGKLIAENGVLLASRSATSPVRPAA